MTTLATRRETSEEAQARRYRALGCVTRLHIVALLRQQGGALCVDDLVEEVAARYRRVEQPTVSHHLRVLSHAGLVEVDHRAGLYVYYRLTTEAWQFAEGARP